MASNAVEHQDIVTSYPFSRFSRKLQILFLASEWGSSKGGLSTINRELAINVAKYCVADVSYFVPRCNDEDKKAAKCHRINLLKAKEVPGVDELQWLCSFPPDCHIDVVVGHGVKLGPQAEFIRRSHKCKWFQVVHTVPEQLGMYKKYSDPILIGEKKHETEVELCKLADCVVSIGPKLLEAFQTYLSSCKKDFFNFTPGVFSEFSEVKQVADRTGKFRVLLFGRGDSEDFELKGCDIAAKAVNALNNTHLIFVGASEKMLEEVKNRFLECGIHANDLTVRSFQLCRESLKSLLCQVDVAIMPSRTEGFGLAGLEALSAGLPVLVSSNSGFGNALSKVVFGSSFVIDSEKPEVWAEKIKNIMDRTRRKRLDESLKLRAFYADEYSWEAQCKELIRKMINVVHECNSTRASQRPDVSTGTEPECCNEPVQIGSQQPNSSTEHEPGTLPVVFRLNSVNFKKGQMGDPKQVMREMINQFFESEAAQVSYKDLPGSLYYYLKGGLGVIIRQTEEGSLIITVECETQEVLEHLWHDYSSGHLNLVAEECLLTNDIRSRFNVKSVELKTTILLKDYLLCKLFLTDLSPTGPAKENQTPQSQPLAANQVLNDAGGFVWRVDDMERFRRFLVLGSEGGTYYATKRKLGLENVQALQRIIAEGRGPQAVKIIVQYSTGGRIAKQDTIILSLAICARSRHLETKRAAYAALSQVLRTPTHLFFFVELCKILSKPETGWGRAHRKAIQKWYTAKKPKALSIAVTKYKQRNGWSHRDMFRLCHLKPTDPAIQLIVKYVIKGFDAVQPYAAMSGVGQDVTFVFTFLKAVEDAKYMNVEQLVQAIKDHGLVREHIPTNHLNSQKIWMALLEKMPMTAMIRNLGKMTNVGVLAPLSDGATKVCEMLGTVKSLKDARVHPFSILLALKQYQAGQGEKGRLKWNPNQAIVTALDKAFYLAFKNVEPTGKRYLLAIGCGDSMSWGNYHGTSITPRVASATMAMLTARTEPQYHFVGFSHHLVRLNINSTQRLDTVLRTIEQVPFGGGADCAQPMIYAKENNLKVDVFIVHTDCETLAGPVHPREALKQYRVESGIDAKLIVCGMTSNGFTLADPEDRGMLDMAGFDSATPDVIRQFVLGL